MSKPTSHACPRCEHRPKMEEASLRGIQVRICRSCKSILMTRAELRAVIGLAARAGARHVDNTTQGFFQRIKHQPSWVNEAPSIRCPVCGYNMYEAKNHGIVVDFCLNCEAVWFDEGELVSTLAAAKRSGGLQLIPDDTEQHETATLIAYMLDTITTEEL